MKSHAFVLAVLLPLGLAAGTVDTAWVRRYDGPRHGQDWTTCLAVDSLGNVYVAGPSAADTGYVNLDYVVIKYRPDGAVAWERRYDFDGGDDIPSGLGVDRQGNVYVTGSGGGRTATIKYDSIGRLVWLRTLGTQGQGKGLVLDGRGNVLLCGATLEKGFTCATTKYRFNGDTAWVRFFEGGGNALAVDANGGPIVVGSYLDTLPRAHCLTLKYDSAGALLWVARYIGSTEAEYLDYVVADGSGNVCAVGSTTGSETGRDYLTIKYGPEGETLWTRRFNGTANDRDEARAVALDGAGNVYVTGYTTQSQPVWECVTLKYNMVGDLLWTARYHGLGNDADAQANDVAVDLEGCVYITGSVWVGQSVGGDLLVVKYGANGDTLWTHTYNGPGNWSDEGKVIAVDGQRNVYAAGRSTGNGTGIDVVTIKYVQSGAVAEPSFASRTLSALTVEPSPCRDHVAVAYSVLSDVRVRLVVRDIAGRRVRVLAEVRQTAGRHAVVWDLLDASGCRVPAGVYVIELQGEAVSSRAKIQVLD